MIENFNKDENRKYGFCPQCTHCRKDFYLKNIDEIKKNNEQNREKRNMILENKRETDVNFRLISNTRNRLYSYLKGMTKQSSAKEVLGINFDLYRK